MLIKNGYVLADDAEGRADLLVEGETIAAIGEPGSISVPPGGEVIDAEGLLILPGGVDVHTHFDLDVGIATACDDFESGTIAAAFGGTTTIVDHIGFGPPGCPVTYQVERYHEKAAGHAVIDYGFHAVIQHVDDQVLRDFALLVDRGITSCKVYTTYGYKIDDGGLLRVLERAKDVGMMVTIHPENDGVIGLLRERFGREGKLSPPFHPRSRPPECEAEAVGRAAKLARIVGDAPLYIVHTTSALALGEILAARERGQGNLWAETCPQYLLLTDDRYEGGDGLQYIMCPPLRKAADNAALWDALASGAINTVATDHCPFTLAQKSAGRSDFRLCPSGAPGVEERLGLLFSEGVQTGRITLRRMVDLTAANRHSRCDYTPYEGMELRGAPVCTVSRGEVLVKDGRFRGLPGRGRFLVRKPIEAR
jgi:dihydropyrimidinase